MRGVMRIFRRCFITDERNGAVKENAFKRGRRQVSWTFRCTWWMLICEYLRNCKLHRRAQQAKQMDHYKILTVPRDIDQVENFVRLFPFPSSLFPLLKHRLTPPPPAEIKPNLRTRTNAGPKPRWPRSTKPLHPRTPGML